LNEPRIINQNEFSLVKLNQLISPSVTPVWAFIDFKLSSRIPLVIPSLYGSACQAYDYPLDAGGREEVCPARRFCNFSVLEKFKASRRVISLCVRA
jgi:hypothetical protein